MPPMVKLKQPRFIRSTWTVCQHTRTDLLITFPLLIILTTGMGIHTIPTGLIIPIGHFFLSLFTHSGGVLAHGAVSTALSAATIISTGTTMAELSHMDQVIQ